MKKACFSLLVLILSFIIAAPVFADVGVTINEEKRVFDPPPVLIDGRTLVPMRAFFEALGANVEWDPVAGVATGLRGGITVCVPIDNIRPTVNRQVVPISVPAQLIKGRTFIPLRFVGEAFGDDVRWDEATRTIIITGGQGNAQPVKNNGEKEVVLTVQQAKDILETAHAKTFQLFDNASEAELFGGKVPFAEIRPELLHFYSENMMHEFQQCYDQIYYGHYNFPSYLPPDEFDSTFKLVNQGRDKTILEITTRDIYNAEDIIMQVELIYENGKWIINGEPMFKVNETVQVYNTGGIGLKLRSLPGSGDETTLLWTMPENTCMKIIGGPYPHRVNGYLWWQLEGHGEKGWAAAPWLRRAEVTSLPEESSQGPATKAAGLEWFMPTENPHLIINYGAHSTNGYHTGVDIRDKDINKKSTAVYAIADGEVAAAFAVQPSNGAPYWSGGEGSRSDNWNMQNVIIIKHLLPDGGEIFSLYAHLRNLKVKEGKVIGGKTILGETGVNLRDGRYVQHVHLELKTKPVTADPQNNGYWGYTPSHPDNYGYKNPMGFIQ